MFCGVPLIDIRGAGDAALCLKNCMFAMLVRGIAVACRSVNLVFPAVGVNGIAPRTSPAVPT